MPHKITSWASKKLIGFLIVLAALLASAIGHVVPSDKFGSLSVALVALYGSFAAANTISGRRAAAEAEVIEPARVGR